MVLKSESRERPLAFVLGDMDMIRSLGLAGIRCAVLGPADSPTVYSRFTQASVHWNGNIWKLSDQMIDELIRFGSEQAQPPVLFYQGDMQLLLISRNRERLRQFFRFVVPEPSLVEDLVDKGRFQALAERENLPVPRSQVIDPVEGQAGFHIDLRFPVIVKPVMRHSSWRTLVGSTKALQIETSAELREMWPQLMAAGMKLLAQELVTGPETCIESYHVYAKQGGDIVADFTGRKVRTAPSSFGYSTAVTISDAADVAELGRHLVRQLQLEGVAKFDFKRGPDGRLYLLEINPRFNLWHHLGAAAGVNLPALVYADLVGLPPPGTGPARVGTSWCKPMVDWRVAKEQGVPLTSRLRWIRHCEAKSVNWDDPLPILVSRLRQSAMFRRLLRSVMSRNIWVEKQPSISVES